MSGTVGGGKKAAITNKNKTTILIDGVQTPIPQGKMYEVIGALGGRKSTGGGR